MTPTTKTDNSRTRPENATMSNTPVDTTDLKPSRQGELLQACVFGVIGLALTLKQLHWNLRGPHFLQVHEFLDVVIDHAREISDELAERMVTLGVPARGQPSAVAGANKATIPDGFLTDKQALQLASDRVGEVIATLRQAQPELGDIDAITEDLVIGSVSTLEKDLWMLRSHLL